MSELRQMEMHEPATPAVRWLGGDAHLIVWNLPNRLWAAPRLETANGQAPSPLTMLRLPTADGGTRVLAAFRRPRDTTLEVSLQAGALRTAERIVLAADSDIPAVDAAELLDGLAPRSRILLASSLLGVWARLFKLRRSRTFTRLADRLAAGLVEAPPEARSVATAAGDLVLVETGFDEAFGEIEAVYAVSERRVRHLAATPHAGPADRRGRRLVHLVLGDDVADRDRLVFIGGKGVAVRRLMRSRALPSLARWWRARPGCDGALREFVVRSLAGGGAAARHAAIEFQIGCPLPAQAVAGGNGLPAADVDIALSVPSGTLVGGWYRDPSSMVAGIDLVDAAGDLHPLDAHWHRFAGRVRQGAEEVPATGFAGFLPVEGGSVPLLQPRFLLRLASGTRYHVVPPQQPAAAAERRALALRAVPPQHLSETIIRSSLAPAIGALQAAVRAEVGAPTTVEIGTMPARPAMSIVVPLYRVLDFLRVQVAAFAADPDIAGHAEIVYVLDSPEQGEAVKHLLDGLHLLYGLPLRLVTMERNGGYALACNRGAAFARAPMIAFLNSDVIPSGPGWAVTLAERLARGNGTACCGPKLLFEDGSIQHAGMYFARNHQGRWLNHHFSKGLPRHFAAANEERSVPAVTGACLVVRRDVFEAVGGFTEDYVIGDYEDSDLCLKIRAAGHDIAYVPAAELYHLERQSIRQSVDYMRGVAAQYNSWLHAQRWEGAMTDLMRPAPDGEAALRSAA